MTSSKCTCFRCGKVFNLSSSLLLSELLAPLNRCGHAICKECKYCNCNYYETHSYKVNYKSLFFALTVTTHILTIKIDQYISFPTNMLIYDFVCWKHFYNIIYRVVYVGQWKNKRYIDIIFIC